MDFHLLDNGEILLTQTDIHLCLSRENVIITSDETMEKPFEKNKSEFEL